MHRENLINVGALICGLFLALHWFCLICTCQFTSLYWCSTLLRYSHWLKFKTLWNVVSWLGHQQNTQPISSSSSFFLFCFAYQWAFAGTRSCVDVWMNETLPLALSEVTASHSRHTGERLTSISPSDGWSSHRSGEFWERNQLESLQLVLDCSH